MNDSGLIFLAGILFMALIFALDSRDAWKERAKDAERRFVHFRINR